jgi:hypothetical protein
MMSKEGSLLAAIKAETNSAISGRVPLVFTVAKQLPDKEQAEFWEAVNDLTIPAPAIVRVLQARNIRITAASINKFRRGEYAHDHE